MRQLFLRYPNTAQRALEIAIPTTSWLLITMPLWLSFWHPALVAYLIITFDVYWFYKSLTLVYSAFHSFLTLSAHVRVDWKALAEKEVNFDKLYHIIIIPEFKEPLHILQRTIRNLSASDFPKEKMIIVLATEAKDTTANETFRALKKEFGSVFSHFIQTVHTLKTGEVSGKSSNMAHAAKCAYDYALKHSVTPHHASIS